MANVPVDGRLTSQNLLNIPLTGGELMYIVSPGNASQGNSYKVTTAVLAAYFSSFSTSTSTVITSGATIVTPYNILQTDQKILLNKTIGSASFLVAPLSTSITSPSTIMIKDLNGDAFTNNITISFTGGELCDGKSTVTIANDYGWVRITPTPGGGSWYQS